MSNWVPFYFESNHAWGFCDTKERWNEIKKNYESESGVDDILDAKQNIDSSRYNFGFRREHQGNATLRDFSMDYNIEL